MTRRKVIDPDDWSQDPRAQEWIANVRHQLIPKIKGSAFSMVLTPEGPPDVKIAVELGMSILLDKPIIFVVPRGYRVSERMLRIADEVVEVDYADMKASGDELLAAMDRMREREEEGHA